jgi:hypothetical protein
MGAGSFMFRSPKHDVILIQSINYTNMMVSLVCTVVKGGEQTYRISKYLALLELPPPLKKLRAMTLSEANRYRQAAAAGRGRNI